MKDIDLTEQQLSAVEMVQNNTISILTGGPGTGKTTTTLEIINWAISTNLKIFQAAATGKAAKRMAEATNFYASTIHSMLECTFKNGSFEFVHNESNSLPVDLIIIDEMSMITLSLMTDVLKAVDINRTRLLFIGDAYQLPSVGAGAILRDLLKSKVIPHIELNIIHRNSGKIVSACHQIKAGILYNPAKKLDLKADSPVNLIHIEQFTPEDTLSAIQKIVCKLIPEKYNFDPVEDIQIISPVNSLGKLSCDSINEMLRDVLNPIPAVSDTKILTDQDQDPNYKFRPGDKVINTKNNTAKLVNETNKVKIVNGDIGKVLSVSSKIITVLFSDPDRKVEILKHEQKLLHAYCITCHRFQGSEAPVIIIPVHNQFNFFLSNAWIYTAISRAKIICITVGSFGTIQKAIRNRVPNDRLTMLSERLIEANRKMMEVEFEGI